jgi:hypothetical protein
MRRHPAQHARPAGGSARKPHALEHAALLFEHDALLSPQPWALARAEDAADLSTPGAALRCGARGARAAAAHRSQRASRHAGLVPPTALRGDAVLRLRAAYNEKARAAAAAAGSCAVGGNARRTGRSARVLLRAAERARRNGRSWS